MMYLSSTVGTLGLFLSSFSSLEALDLSFDLPNSGILAALGSGDAQTNEKRAGKFETIPETDLGDTRTTEADDNTQGSVFALGDLICEPFGALYFQGKGTHVNLGLLLL